MGEWVKCNVAASLYEYSAITWQRHWQRQCQRKVSLTGHNSQLTTHTSQLTTHPMGSQIGINMSKSKMRAYQEERPNINPKVLHDNAYRHPISDKTKAMILHQAFPWLDISTHVLFIPLGVFHPFIYVSLFSFWF